MLGKPIHLNSAVAHRTGGLEKHEAGESGRSRVAHRTGGLEIHFNHSAKAETVAHRTGGLENFLA